jgi:hypothetical protein
LLRTVSQDVRPWSEEVNVGDAGPDSICHTSTLARAM